MEADSLMNEEKLVKFFIIYSLNLDLVEFHREAT
jgi:hypothetical protein